ncbi:olfactory receptor 13A1-like, partial [Arvicola amphibius]|uniref:olfactory receptor 13A1-like n=1 Tax=Arvicola amphibius TaxID=1047088 RepID=UPI001C089B18
MTAMDCITQTKVSRYKSGLSEANRHLCTSQDQSISEAQMWCSCIKFLSLSGAPVNHGHCTLIPVGMSCRDTSLSPGGGLTLNSLFSFLLGLPRQHREQGAPASFVHARIEQILESSGLKDTCDPELQPDKYWAERQTEGIWGLNGRKWEEVSKAQVLLSSSPCRRKALICAFAGEKICFLVQDIPWFLAQPDTFSDRHKLLPGPEKGMMLTIPHWVYYPQGVLRVARRNRQLWCSQEIVDFIPQEPGPSVPTAWNSVTVPCSSPPRTQSQITMNNYTAVAEFVLQEFSGDPGFQAFLFAFFSIFYTMAVTGNTLIFMAISLNSSLHTPMYFFLANLALLDIVCTSTVLPKLLEGLVGKGSHISYKGCLTQLFFLTWVLGAELLLLTAMAYDRYVAICRPLHYSMLMSRPVCVLLAGSVWVSSAINTSVHTGLMARLHFCGPNQIRHFLCEIPALLQLSCSPTTLNNIMTIIADAFYGVVNFLFTMISYSFIIASILLIRSAEGKKRAFSTCSAHLVVVTLYYSTVIYTYVQPGSGSSLENSKVVVLLYTAVCPTLNPLIYSLRNKDVKVALRKLLA